ncbi:MAG: hypothetical protein C4K58_02060 [Flavobacteriaceae bacterium]|nr:MAG: hypothetical protein C4K58_02060 [Flavobacteriaceae bacterium]
MKKIVCLFTLVLAGSLSMAQNSKKTAAKYYNNGVEYGNSKNYSSAIRSYDKAIELNPNDAIAYINRGAAYGYRGEYDKAMSDFNKALTINPEVSLGYTNRGIIKMDANVSKSVDKANVLYASGNYREAALAYKSVLSVDPENVSALNNLGNAYFKMNEKSEACIQWEKAMNLGSENSKNNFEKACR